MKLFEDKADYEDFVDFAVGTAWVLLFTLIASGIENDAERLIL